MQPYTLSIAEELYALADADKAVAMKAYMKNQFEFLGIQTPLRRKVCKAYMKRHNITGSNELTTVVKELWVLPQREFQYVAIELLLYYHKMWNQGIIENIEHCIVTQSWWDTVDFIASDCCGKYFRKFPEQVDLITGRWNTSKNMWLQRSSFYFRKVIRRIQMSNFWKLIYLTCPRRRSFSYRKRSVGY